MGLEATIQITHHIQDKIVYHEKLRQAFEAAEEYEKCSYHRDEIARLKKMLE